MSVFSSFFDFLKAPVGDNLDNHPDDIRTAKTNLSRLGHFEEKESNHFITRALDDGIRRFQKENDLRVDGKMYPGGETERTIFKKLERRDPAPYFCKPEKEREHVGFGGNISGTFENGSSMKHEIYTSPSQKEKMHDNQYDCNQYEIETVNSEAQLFIIQQKLSQETTKKLTLEIKLNALNKKISSENNDKKIAKRVGGIGGAAMVGLIGGLRGGKVGALTGASIGLKYGQPIAQTVEEGLDALKGEKSLMTLEKEAFTISKELKEANIIIDQLTTEYETKKKIFNDAKQRYQNCKRSN